MQSKPLAYPVMGERWKQFWTTYPGPGGRQQLCHDVQPSTVHVCACVRACVCVCVCVRARACVRVRVAAIYGAVALSHAKGFTSPLPLR